MAKDTNSAIVSLKQFNSLTKKGMNFFCLDLETTGLNPKEAKITNFAAIRLALTEEGNLEELDRMNILVNPEIPIPAEVQALTGITDQMVSGARKYPEAYQLIKMYIGNAPIVVGYNSNFDIRFLESMYEENRDIFEPVCHVDTFKMVKEKVHGTENKKLKTVASALKVDGGLTFHHALDDVMATIRVFDAVRRMYTKEDYEGSAKAIASHEEPFKVLSLNRWKKFSIDRIYVANNWNDSVYYDIKTGAWEFGASPSEQVKAQAYELAGVTSDEGLVAAITKNA